MTLGPAIEHEESMGDPELQGFASEANPFGAAKAMGQQHRHMAGELAARALQHQGQPGVGSVSPQRPQADLGDFREFAGIFGLPGPVELQGQLGSALHQAGWLEGCPGIKGGQSKLLNGTGANQQRASSCGHGDVGHQEL